MCKTTPLLLIIAVFFRFQGIIGQETIDPNVSEYCDYDAFISSAPINNKVFLHPVEKADRQGDWYQARGYCAKHCAEMVTIKSAQENHHLLDFMKEVNNRLGVWLGAEIMDKASFAKWNNGEDSSYQPIKPGEYNEGGHTCASNWDFGQLGFCNDPCSWDRLIACQRPATWKPCSA